MVIFNRLVSCDVHREGGICEITGTLHTGDHGNVRGIYAHIRTSFARARFLT